MPTFRPPLLLPLEEASDWELLPQAVALSASTAEAMPAAVILVTRRKRVPLQLEAPRPALA
jgi:hypothetical protein